MATTDRTVGVEAKQGARTSNFTIEHILRHAGCRRQQQQQQQQHDQQQQQHELQQRQQQHDAMQIFDWLHCTRYRPPKLNRSKKKEGGARRRLGRNPRIPFSAAQVAVLEDKFRASAYLSTSDVGHLATLLRLSDTRIKIWFQNRRARERRDHGRVDMLSQTPPPRHSSDGPVKSAFSPPAPAPSPHTSPGPAWVKPYMPHVQPH